MKRPRLRLRVGRWTASVSNGHLYSDQAPDPHCDNCRGAGGKWIVYENSDPDPDTCWCWHPGHHWRLWPLTRRRRHAADEPPF